VIARRSALVDMAERQISELLMLLATTDEEILRRPCPGRAKLGDGSIGAVARHIADSYERIAAFVTSVGAKLSGHAGTDRSGHNAPDTFQRIPDRPHDDHRHAVDNVEPGALVAQLVSARDQLGHIAQLTNGQLDAVPLAGSFRFCDGQRTLEQVLESLLKHQQRQLDALTAAIGRP
jgi:DinB superfamily